MRYKVNLKKYMSDCEANYYRLLKLLPNTEKSDHYRFCTDGSAESLLVIDVLERTPYTTLIRMAQKPGTEACSWLRLPEMKVRLYHDARLAEVVTCENYLKVQPKLPYPNSRMHQPDEKAQWNSFLTDWLANIARTAYVESSPCTFGMPE